MRAALATWLAGALVERDDAGASVAPGGRVCVRLDEADGRTLAAVSQGEALDLYFAGARTAVAFSCTPRTALRLAWWIAWRWWVRATWCGLKPRLWQWALRARLEARRGERRR